MSKSKFYSLDSILSKKCQYNIIIGERSNGKSYAFLERALRRWWEFGEQSAYIRRWKEDYRGKRGTQLFAGHTENGFIEELTGGEWNTVKYYSGKWFLAKKDEELDRLISQEEQYCFEISLS